MVEVTKDYATHFCDMYVDKHEGKHLSGERVRILLLTLPFLLRDLIAPEVKPFNMLINVLFNMLYADDRSSLSMIPSERRCQDPLCTSYP